MVFAGMSYARRSPMKAHLLSATAFAVLCLASQHGFALTLGSFQFNDSQFGNTLGESDGGTFRNGNWLNVVNANPGNPGALTGANVNTGIANIGFDGNPPIYTIGYNTGIANGAGDDLGIISARFSLNDTWELAVSTDGITFSSFMSFGPALGVDTGVMETYFYDGGGPFPATLFVTPIDLSLFGLNPGDTIAAVQITCFQEGDLIRVAGLGQSSGVPEGGTTLILLGAGLGVFGFAHRIANRYGTKSV
jgi:hypothetical protein